MIGTDKTALRHFFQGVILVVAVQAVFMAGGLLMERLADKPVTGIPTVIGLTAVLIIGSILSTKKSLYLLMGSFSLAFLAPAILLLVVLFDVFPISERLLFFSMGYSCALTFSVWFYFLFKAWRGNIDADTNI